MSMTLEENAYASQSNEVYRVQPTSYTNGVTLYDPLYAEYWNWLWNYSTKNLVYFNEDIDTLSEYISELETLDDTLKSNIATSSLLGRIIVEENTPEYSLGLTESGSLYVVGLSDYVSIASLSLSFSLDEVKEDISALENDCSSIQETLTSILTDSTFANPLFSLFIFTEGEDTFTIGGAFTDTPSSVYLGSESLSFSYSYPLLTVSSSLSSLTDGDYSVVVVSSSYSSSPFTLGVKDSILIGATSVIFNKSYISSGYVYLFGVFPTNGGVLDDFYVTAGEDTKSLIDLCYLYTSCCIMIAVDNLSFSTTEMTFSITYTNIAGTQATVSSDAITIGE